MVYGPDCCLHCAWRLSHTECAQVMPRNTYTLELTGGNAAVFLFPRNSGPFMVVNGDPQYPIYLGDDSSVNANNPSECIPVLPGASVGFSNGRDFDTFINGTPGVVSQVYIIPGASGYFRPISDLILQGINPGVFLYRPSVGFDNLVGAWAASAGVDQWGNAYGAGITLNQGTIQGISVSDGSILGTYLQSNNILGSSIGGASISGGSILGANIIQTANAGEILSYSSGLFTVTLSQNTDWVAPAGVTVAKIETVGGSGGGGANGPTGGAGAGGGPEYASEPNYPLVPGRTYKAIVGIGGMGANGNGSGSPGGITSFDNTVISHPGQGGGPTLGGLPGSGSINTIHHSGGIGGRGNLAGGGGGGGSAGTATGVGANGVDASSSAGAAGGSPGGGQGGASGQAGLAGSAGGGGGAGSGSQGTSFVYYPKSCYSYYGADATTNPANGLRSTDGLLYSGEDTLGTYNGNEYSFAYYGSVSADLAGLSIISCQLVCQVDYVFNQFATLVLGYAPFTTFGGTGNLSGASPDLTQCTVSGQAIYTIDLTTSLIPAAFQNGSATCILFGPAPTDSANYFCEVNGAPNQKGGPYLVFNTH
jgi:hypothetical protein